MNAWMPGASRAQDFSGIYSGVAMTPRVGVIHTTEGTGWPGYRGGADAPHFTVRGGEIRQHFPVNRSARALVNAPGGVETNTAGAVQIEIVGTCDPRFKARHPSALLVPDANADDLAGFLRVVAWLEKEWGIPRRDAARAWLAYGVDPRRPGVTPASYGASPARMSGAEWLAARGWVGHQHVPENSHGDPGNFPIRLLTGSTPTPITPESEEDDDMATAGFIYVRAADKYVMQLIVDTVSGWYHEYSSGTKGSGGGYNNPIAAALKTGSYATITESHARVIKAACDRLRDSTVKVEIAKAEEVS